MKRKRRRGSSNSVCQKRKPSKRDDKTRGSGEGKEGEGEQVEITHQNHVASGDVHVGGHGLLTPGRNTPLRTIIEFLVSHSVMDLSLVV